MFSFKPQRSVDEISLINYRRKSLDVDFMEGSLNFRVVNFSAQKVCTHAKNVMKLVSALRWCDEMPLVMFHKSESVLYVLRRLLFKE